MVATTRRLYQRQWGRALSSQFIAYGAAMGLCLNCLCVLNMLGWVLPASLLGFAVRYMAVGSAFMTCLVMLLQAQHRAAEVSTSAVVISQMLACLVGMRYAWQTFLLHDWKTLRLCLHAYLTV